MILTLIPYLFSFIALLLTAYLAFRREGQEDKQNLLSRVSKIEIEQANQIVRQQGFQTEIEGVADFGKRERMTMMETIKRDHDRDHESIKDSIKDVPAMRVLLYRMTERLESTKESMANLERKMDRIVELLTHKSNS